MTLLAFTSQQWNHLRFEDQNSTYCFILFRVYIFSQTNKTAVDTNPTILNMYNGQIHISHRRWFCRGPGARVLQTVKHWLCPVDMTLTECYHWCLFTCFMSLSCKDCIQKFIRSMCLWRHVLYLTLVVSEYLFIYLFCRNAAVAPVAF